MIHLTRFPIAARPIEEEVYLVEGDMLLTKEQNEMFSQHKNGRVRRAAMKDKYLWPNGIVYYTFAPDFGKFIKMFLLVFSWFNLTVLNKHKGMRKMKEQFGKFKINITIKSSLFSPCFLAAGHHGLSLAFAFFQL